MKRLLFAAALVGIIPLAVNAQNWGRDDDRKAPPPTKADRACRGVYIREFPNKCKYLSPETMNELKLRTGQKISVKQLLDIQEAYGEPLR